VEMPRCGWPWKTLGSQERADKLALAFSTAIHNAWKSQKARFPHFHSADGFLSSPMRAKKEQLISCALD